MNVDGEGLVTEDDERKAGGIEVVIANNIFYDNSIYSERKRLLAAYTLGIPVVQVHPIQGGLDYYTYCNARIEKHLGRLSIGPSTRLFLTVGGYRL